MAEPDRDTPERRDERARWSRDIAKMLRGMTGVSPDIRPGLRYAADLLDPPPMPDDSAVGGPQVDS